MPVRWRDSKGRFTKVKPAPVLIDPALVAQLCPGPRLVYHTWQARERSLSRSYYTVPPQEVSDEPTT